MTQSGATVSYDLCHFIKGEITYTKYLVATMRKTCYILPLSREL